MKLNVRYSRPNNKRRSLIRGILFISIREDHVRAYNLTEPATRGPQGRVCQPTTPLADAPGGALSSVVPGGEAWGAVLSRSLSDAEACGRSDAPAVTALPIRCRDRLLRYSHRALRTRAERGVRGRRGSETRAAS